MRRKRCSLAWSDPSHERADGIAKRRERDVRAKRRAVFARKPDVMLGATVANRGRQEPFGLSARSIVRCKEARERAASGLGRRELSKSLRTRIPHDDHAVGVECNDGIVPNTVDQPTVEIAVGGRNRGTISHCYSFDGADLHGSDVAAPTSTLTRDLRQEI